MPPRPRRASPTVENPTPPSEAPVFGLDVVDMPINSITPYPANARVITDVAVQKVADSLEEFGWQQPIVVDTDMVIVVGHTRHRAAKFLGLDTVPVHVARNLTKIQADAYRLLDNRANQESLWDNEILVKELAAIKSEGYNLELTGFDKGEVDAFLDSQASVDETVSADLGTPPAGQIACPRCGKHFVPIEG